MAESTTPPRRRAKRFLSAEKKYEIWLKILTGELTSREAAAQAGVDRSTIMTLRKTAKEAPSLPCRRRGRVVPATPGTSRRWPAWSWPLCGEIGLGLSGPVPQRVPGDVKDKLLAIIDDCVAAGWTTERACAVLGVARRRVWRWQCRRDAGGNLDDHRPGGHPAHGLLPWEIQAILALPEEWGPVDRSHRKLAHRGSYLERLWVAPSTVRRVLAGHDVDLPAPPPRPAPRERKPWPDWVEYRPRQVWGWDVTHFGRCKPAPNCFAIIDLVSRRWISTLLSPEETAVQTQVVFLDALEAEGFLAGVEHRLTTGELPAADEIPILVAMSDNGPPMTAADTRSFMALCSIAQHFGRPRVPTDQAPVESFIGHIKAEWPHLEDIGDPEVLAAELERVRHDYNSVRLHAAIGYVTPNDEHEGRGDVIRQARHDGLARADQARRAARRPSTNHRPEHPR